MCPLFEKLFGATFQQVVSNHFIFKQFEQVTHANSHKFCGLT